MRWKQITEADKARVDITLPDGSKGQAYIDRNGKVQALLVDPPQGQPGQGQGQPSQGGQQGQQQVVGQGDQEGGDSTTDYIPSTNLRHNIDDMPEIPTDVNFRNRLASVLKDNASVRVQRNLKRGKLDMKRLWKAGTNSENLFKKKADKSGKKYNVVLLVDESGSMKGAYIRRAANVAAFLCDNMERLAIDLSVIGYDGATHMRKTFDQKIHPRNLQEDIVGNMGGGSTDDYGALTEAYKQLQGRDGESLAIVVTDGGGYDIEVLKPFIEKHRQVKTFAIGIGPIQPRGYPHSIMANKIDELKPLVLSILKSQITRR